MTKSERREAKRKRLKAKWVKHGEGKRKPKQGLSKQWIKHLKSKIKQGK